MDTQLRTLLTTPQVRKRYGGVAAMTIWRWQRDEAMAFPAPLKINNRKFWDLADLETWERRQAVRHDDAPRGRSSSVAVDAVLDTILGAFGEAGANITALGVLQAAYERGCDEPTGMAVLQAYAARQRPEVS